MRMILAAAAVLFCNSALAQNQSQDFQDGYRKGFQDGFEQGRKFGVAPAGTAPATAAPAAAPVAAPAATQPAKPQGIVVLKATYGDFFNQCDATSYVAGQSRDKRAVTFRVTNNMCGDPAPGKRKELKVTYHCGSVQRDVTNTENRDVMLDCNR